MKLDIPQSISDPNSDPETKSVDDDATVAHDPLKFDIEHMPVADDPRKWSNVRKVCLQNIYRSSMAFIQNSEFDIIPSRTWVYDCWFSTVCYNQIYTDDPFIGLATNIQNRKLSYRLKKAEVINNSRYHSRQW